MTADGMSGHGTYGGYQRHRKKDEEPCWPCREANVRYRREWRKRGRCMPGLGWPLGPGDIAPARPSEIPWAKR